MVAGGNHAGEGGPRAAVGGDVGRGGVVPRLLFFSLLLIAVEALLLRVFLAQLLFLRGLDQGLPRPL